MPNGHQPCCADGCTYNSETHGVPQQARCDVFGIETDLNGGCMVCRMFRRPRQSHMEARKESPQLLDLKAGAVYHIRNTSEDRDWHPRAIYRVTAVR